MIVGVCCSLMLTATAVGADSCLMHVLTPLPLCGGWLCEYGSLPCYLWPFMVASRFWAWYCITIRLGCKPWLLHRSVLPVFVREWLGLATGDVGTCYVMESHAT